jgi:hypothetical protein
MTPLTRLNTLPRVVVGGYLRAVGLPLHAAARLTGHGADQTWPPALAFEGAVAGIGSTLAALVGDDEWLESSRLRQAKVTQLRTASELEVLADQQESAAQREFDQRKHDADKRREEARVQADRREAELEQRATEKARSLEQRATRQKAGARQTRAKRDAAIDAAARRAKAHALAEESAAIDAAQDAISAEKVVDAIDDTIEKHRAARKSG